MKLLQVLQLTVIVALTWSSQAYAGVPYPNSATPKAVDLGALSEQAGATPVSITIALRLPNLGDAENLLRSLHTPQDPQYHQFLTPEQFVARFAPTDSDVVKVVASLKKYGLTAERATSTTLKVTGLPADLERAFAVSLHSYNVPAHGNAAAYTFHAPLARPTVPAEISASVAGVFGLDTRPSWRPLHQTAPLPMKPANSGLTVATGTLTVLDFAKQYDVNPLYRRGLTGAGRTLGIMTLASFTPSDAFKYWNALGLTVDPGRITIVNVDGGPGSPSDASGSIETTLDVEQSGGIAPGAKVIVYQAPNTNQGFVDLFATAIDANLAESLSVSWGEWEWFENLENSPVTDPTSGNTVGVLQAAHELFVRAAIQGQTLFTASGDGGAYEMNHDLGCFGPYSTTVSTSCSQPLTVSYPASDPAITAAGGTTLPGIQEFCLNKTCTQTYSLTIPRQRVWGWDYLEGLCKTLGAPNPVACGIFPGGSGGGVSVFFDKPSYQYGLSGTQLSQPGQVFEMGATFAAELGLATDYFALPGYYQGRNVPDISFNADPDTGYEIYYTSSASGFGIASFYGGTSFVAPQLNGVSALLGEELYSRLGLLNYPLYGLALSGQAYRGPFPPIHAIQDGDNWFYHGSNGYNPAVGLGALDVANFADVLRGMF
jgi:subtilase family serine protease